MPDEYYDDQAEFDAIFDEEEAPLELDATPEGAFASEYTLDETPQLDFSAPGLGGIQLEGDSAFFDAVQRGMDNSTASLYAVGNAIGSLTGVNAIEEWGYEGWRDQLLEAAQNPSHLGPEDDVDTLAEVGTYVAEAVGENLINIGIMATGGGIGVQAAKAAVGKAAIQHVEKQAAALALAAAKKKGAKVGAFAGAYGLQGGEVQSEFLQHDIDRPGLALAAGVPGAALELAGFEKIIGQLFKGMPVTSATQLIKETAKGFGTAAMVEAPTEAVQELITLTARHVADPSFEIFTDENYERLKEAGLKGGVAGGFTGGAFRGASAALETYSGVRDYIGDKADKIRTATKGKVGEGLKPEDRGPGFEAGDVAAGFGFSGNLQDPAVKDLFEELNTQAGTGADVFTAENEARVKAATEKVGINVDDIPARARVRVEAVVDGKTVQLDMPARDAIRESDSQIDVYSRLRKCLG